MEMCFRCSLHIQVWTDNLLHYLLFQSLTYYNHILIFSSWCFFSIYSFLEHIMSLAVCSNETPCLSVHTDKHLIVLHTLNLDGLAFEFILMTLSVVKR